MGGLAGNFFFKDTQAEEKSARIADYVGLHSNPIIYSHGFFREVEKPSTERSKKKTGRRPNSYQFE